MFNKVCRIKEDKLIETLKSVELEARKESKQEYDELSTRYILLKQELIETQKKYIEVIQEYDILKAQLKEIQMEIETKNTEAVEKYSDLANKLFSDTDV